MYIIFFFSLSCSLTMESYMSVNHLMSVERDPFHELLHQGTFSQSKELVPFPQAFDDSWVSLCGMNYDPCMDSSLALCPLEESFDNSWVSLCGLNNDLYFDPSMDVVLPQYPNIPCKELDFNFNVDTQTFEEYYPSLHEGSLITPTPLNTMICNNVANVLQENPSAIQRQIVSSFKDIEVRTVSSRHRSKCSKTVEIEFEDIARYFDVPITRAARELKIGLTALKKRCRELKIERWPHRKIQSLKSLIGNLKELGWSAKEIEMLQEHKRLIAMNPEIDLTPKTKKLRQACFKANYKRRKSLSITSS